MKFKKSIAALMAAGAVVSGVAACQSDADVASENLSKAAEQFEINRRIVAINTITDKYLWAVEGKCSIEFPDGRVELTCKLKDGSFVKHFSTKPDNVVYWVEQTNGTNVSTDQYRVIFKPETIVPNVDRP